MTDTEKKSRIHELHHHVLESWDLLKKQTPYVVCFDHHTDILPAFLRNNVPENAGKCLVEDIKHLRHDEHFDYALKYRIISGACIISHTPAATIPAQGIQVLYNGDFSEDEPLNSEKYRRYFDEAVEDRFLEQFSEFFPAENYILDIDCDYFKTEKSLDPDSCEIFRRLMRNAEMITFSREDDWVKLLTFEDSRNFTPEYIISKLTQLL